MAGIGERMASGGQFVFRDGYSIGIDPDNPLPDDETLSRLKKQGDEFHRRVPQTVGAELRPFHYRRRTPED